MPVDWNARRARGRFFLGSVALVVIGACCGVLGYQDGEALALAWSRVSMGAGLAAMGLLGLLLISFSAAARRERMLFSATVMRSRRTRVSAWMASLVVGAFVFAYFYATSRA